MKKLLLLSVLLVISCSKDDDTPELICKTYEFEGITYTFTVQNEEQYQDVINNGYTHKQLGIYERAYPCE